MGLCERCKKAKATFHLTNIDRDGEKVEQHLCDQCASAAGLLPTSKSTIDLNEVLENFISGAQRGGADLSNLLCDQCGMSYIEFRNQGLLGCAHDYEAFAEPLQRLIERTHDGATTHVGKAPKAAGAGVKPQQDIRRLRRQLAEAVAAEDYERAAELRDRIQQLEKA